jgi:hypothetical protein
VAVIDLNYSKYWNTKRIVDVPQTTEEWGHVWAEIGAVFRPRSGEREGCICTNHQGFIAVQATLAMSAGRPLADLTLTDGLTLQWPWAFDVREQLQRQALSWSGKAQSKLQKLSDVIAEALADSMMKKKQAVAVVDTSSLLFGRWPKLWYEKYKRRHEATHIWQYTLNDKNLGLISEEKMLADPEYAVIAEKLEDYYPKMAPADVYSEAIAFLIAGQGVPVGLPTKKRANAFLERFFKEVQLEYGQQALDRLRIVHPRVRQLLDNVRSESVERIFGREEARRSGNAVESGAAEQIADAGRRDEVSPGSMEERRDDGTEAEVKIRKGIILTEMGGFNSEISFGEKRSIETAPKGDRALAPQQSLEKIATINLSDPNETRLWSTLGSAAVAIAREAVAGLKSAEDGAVISALREIAQMKPSNGSDIPWRSWNDVTVMAVETARAALDAISQDASVETDIGVRAAEVARNALRAPAEGIGW